MQYAVFLRDEYILLSTFCRTSSTYTFCIFYNQPRNIRTTFYILHFAGRINFLSYLYILHSADQNIFSTSFTLYIFRHLPNSASTFCLRHYQYLPDFFTRYHRIWRIFWSEASQPASRLWSATQREATSYVEEISGDRGACEQQR